MSENRVIRELGLEDFFDYLLNSSQDDRSNSSNSYGKKSRLNEIEIEKPRGATINHNIETEYRIQDKITNIPEIRVLGSPATPTSMQKKAGNYFSNTKLSEKVLNGVFQNVSGGSESSGARTPSVNFENRQLDAEFMKFDPTIYHSSQKTVKSNNSGPDLHEKLFLAKSDDESKASPLLNEHMLQGELKLSQSNVKGQEEISPTMEENVVRKKRTNSFDDADFDAMDMILEEAKKSSNGEGSNQNIGGDSQEQNKIQSISPPEVNLNGLVDETTPQKPFAKNQSNVTPFSGKPTSISKSSIERLKEVVFEADASGQKVFGQNNNMNSPSIKLFAPSSNSETPSKLPKSQISELSATKSKIMQLNKLDLKSKLSNQSPAKNFQDIIDGFTQEDLDFLDQQLNDQTGKNNRMEIEEPLLMTGSRKPIKISDEHLKDAEKLLSNHDNLDEFAQQNGEPVLKTGLGKSITTNNKNLEKVKKLFEDDEAEDLWKTLNKPTQDDSEPVLMTASRKPIPIQNDKLKAAQKLFASDSQELMNQETQKDDIGFKTGSMKPVFTLNNTKNTKLDAFKDMFEDGSAGNSQEFVGFAKAQNEEPVGGFKTALTTTKPVVEEFSFKTASMKPATFNQNNNKLDAFKDLFEDGFAEDSQELVQNEESTGFKAVSFVKPVVQSHQPSDKFDEFKDMFEEINSLENGNLKEQPAVTEEFAFKTASMKPATFSKTNNKLDAFKDIFEDGSAGNSQEFDGFGKAQNEESTGFKTALTTTKPVVEEFSFKTASMKPATFSKNNNKLGAFKDLFEDGSDGDSQELVDQAAKQAPKEESGLKTASLKHAITFDPNRNTFKDMFEDLDSAKNSQEKNADVKHQPAIEEFSFKTASMKPAIFSKNNNKLDAFKDLFEDGSAGNSQEDVGFSNGNGGFQSAFTKPTKQEEEEPMFKTGNLKPAKFEPSRLESFKNFFEDENDDGDGEKGNSPSNDEPVLMTGNRKPIAVDMEKIKFAENLLKDDGSEEGSEKSKSKKVFFKNKKMEEEPMIMTASRKPINANPDKLKRFQDIFEKDDEEEDEFVSMDTRKSTMVEETKSTSNGGGFFEKSRDFMMNDRGAKSNNVPFSTKREETKSNTTKIKIGNIQGPTGAKKPVLGFGAAGIEAAQRLFGGGPSRNVPPAAADVSQRKLSPNRITKQNGPTITRGSPQSNKYKEIVNSKDYTQTGAKKVLTEDLRIVNKNKEPTLNPMLTMENGLTQKNGSTKEVKKNNGFKFVKGSDGSSKNSGSPVPGEKKKLKRNYGEFKKEIFIDENLFKDNPKVKRFIYKLKHKKVGDGLQKTYFFMNNYKTHPLESAVKEHIGISPSNSLDFKFICPCANFFQSQSLNSDSPSNEVCYCNGSLAIGWSELRQCLLKDKLNEEFLKEEWVKTHYRLIVWKLASIERRLFLYDSTKALTFANVKAELEYRYFVEYSEGRRSALLKVIQQDPIPSNHFVLLVGEIIITPQNSVLVELTDGWYSVYFEVKPPEGSFTGDKNSMTNNQLLYILVKSKKLFTGTKIHLFGINLRKNKSDLPSEENEGPQRAMIDVSYNCMSMARWNEKLGLALRRPLFLLKNLASIKTQGGIIPEIDVYVLKKYKLLEQSKLGLRQYQEEGGEEGKKIFFKLRVLDSILFYNTENKKQKFKDIYCEIEITGSLCAMYDEIKENERLKLRYFDGNLNSRHSKEKYYDHETGKTYSKYLFLKSSRISQMETAAVSPALKKDLPAYKEYFKQNFKNSFLLTSLNMSPQSISFIQKELFKYNNEVDIVGIILKPTPHKTYGCLSNGHLFQIMIHSNTFFSNQKSLDKANSIIYFRNLQLHDMEYIESEQVYCYSLRSNEYSFLAPLQNSIQSETEILNGVIRDKALLEQNKEKLNRAIKKA